MQLKIDYLVVATGSGGTQAGLLMGQKFFRQPFQVIGFNVCDDEAFFVDKINRICKDSTNKYKIPLDVKPNDIKLIDGYVGKGYALNSPEEIEFMKLVARTEGLILDPVYTGKALFGLADQIKQSRFKKGEKILFIHTGGIFGLFPKKEMFF